MEEKIFENSYAINFMEEVLERFKFRDICDLDIYKNELTIVVARKIRLEFKIINEKEFDKIVDILNMLDVYYESY